MFKADPLSAEIDFRGDLFQLGRTILSGTFESLDENDPSLKVEEKYSKIAPTTGQAIDYFGLG